MRISDWSSDVCSSDLVQEVDLAVASGQIHALIGPNGAGKTTTFNLISGLYLPDGGTVRLNGRDIGGLPAHPITRRGLARSFRSEERRVGTESVSTCRFRWGPDH